MESVDIKFNDPDLFDRYLEENRRAEMPECGDLEIVIKENATVGGKSAAMITFTVMINGERRRVQTVTTLTNLSAIAHACYGRVVSEELNAAKGPVQ